MITLSGFFFTIFGVVLLSMVSPDLKTETHSFVYFIFALCVWLNSTFDNVDGKQARRTNSSSALGELFDHGCDALCVNVMAVFLIGLVCLRNADRQPWHRRGSVFHWLSIDSCCFVFPMHVGYLPYWMPKPGIH